MNCLNELKNNLENSVNCFDTISYCILGKLNKDLEKILNRDKEVRGLLEKALSELHPKESLSDIRLFVSTLASPQGLTAEEKKISRKYQVLFNINQPLAFKKITPLMIAILFGNKEAFQILLKMGVNPDSQDIYGWTALHHAAALNKKWFYNILLKYGADNSIKNNRDGTASDLLDLVNLEMPEELPIQIEEGSELKPLTNKEFKKLTGADYITRLFMTSDMLYKKSYTEYTPIVRDEFLKKVEENKKKGGIFPLYLKKEEENIGYGVCSKGSIPPFTIIEEYIGEIYAPEEEHQDKDYLLYDTQGREKRNIAVMINDAFNNVDYLNINFKGIARNFIVTNQDISPGSFLYVNYGTAGIKHYVHKEIRYGAVQKYVTKFPIKKTLEQVMNKMKELQKKGIRCTIGNALDYWSIYAKFVYLTCTPYTMLRLLLENKISLQDLKSMQAFPTLEMAPFFTHYMESIQPFLILRDQLPKEYQEVIASIFQSYFEEIKPLKIYLTLQALGQHELFNAVFKGANEKANELNLKLVRAKLSRVLETVGNNITQ